MKKINIYEYAFAGFSMINMVLFPAIPIYMSEISDKKYFIGLVFSLPVFTSILMNLFWGALSDRLNDRNKVVLYTSLLGSLLFFVVPHVDAKWCVIVKSIQACFLTSSFLLIAHVTDNSIHKGKSIGNLFAAGCVGSVIGSLLYAIYDLLGGFTNWQIFFYTCGSIYFISSFLLFFQKENSDHIIKRANVPLFKFENYKIILVVLLCHFFLGFGTNIVMAIFSVYIKSELKVSHFSIGMLWALGSLLAVFAFKMAGQMVEIFGRRPVIIGSIISYFFATFCYIFLTNPTILGLLWVFPIAPFFWLPGTAIISDITKRAERGRGIALFTSAGSLGTVAGGLLSGFLADILPNMRYVFSFSFIFIVISLVFAFKMRETKDMDGNN